MDIILPPFNTSIRAVLSALQNSIICGTINVNDVGEITAEPLKVVSTIGIYRWRIRSMLSNSTSIEIVFEKPPLSSPVLCHENVIMEQKRDGLYTKLAIQAQVANQAV